MRVLAAKLVFQDRRKSALGIVAAVQRGAVGSVDGRLGRRCSPFAVWIWLVPARAAITLYVVKKFARRLLGWER